MGFETWPLASNAATGPAAGQAVAASAVNVSWAAIASGGSGANVPVTPKASNRVRVTFSVPVSVSGGSAVNAAAQLQQNGVAVGAGGLAQGTVPATTGQMTLSATWVGTLTTPLNSVQNFQVSVTGNGVTIVASGASISIDELPQLAAECG